MNANSSIGHGTKPAVVPGNRSYSEAARAKATSSGPSSRDNKGNEMKNYESRQHLPIQQKTVECRKNDSLDKASGGQKTDTNNIHAILDEVEIIDADTQDENTVDHDEEDDGIHSNEHEQETEENQEVFQVQGCAGDREDQLTTSPADEELNDCSCEGGGDNVGKDLSHSAGESGNRLADQKGCDSTIRQGGIQQEETGEAIVDPPGEVRDSRPAARSLRSNREAQKGRANSQSSIVDSFQRMKSGDRGKDSQTRKEKTQNRSTSKTNR